jgi:hypothetical protein
MIPRGLCDAAKNLTHELSELPLVDRILIAATHTHTAPTVAGVFQSEPDEEYQEFLVRRIADGIRRASNNLAPAKLGWAVGRAPEQVFNRRWYLKEPVAADPFGGLTDRVKMNPPRASAALKEPAGPTDPEVCLLAVASPEGRPIAVLGNYSLHYVGDTGPNHVSADYFAVFADRMQQLLSADRLDPPFVGILSNGTSGGVPRSAGRPSGIAVSVRPRAGFGEPAEAGGPDERISTGATPRKIFTWPGMLSTVDPPAQPTRHLQEARLPPEAGLLAFGLRCRLHACAAGRIQSYAPRRKPLQGSTESTRGAALRWPRWYVLVFWVCLMLSWMALLLVVLFALFG